MKIIGVILTIILISLGVIIGAVVVLNLFQLAIAIYQGAKTLEPSVYVPLTVTILTAALGLSATLWTQMNNRKREIEAAYRERKIEIYLSFLQTLANLHLAEKPELGRNPIDENQLVVDLVDIRTKAVLWGSPGVLKALSDFAKVHEENPLAMFDLLERIQREIRRDLGLSNKGLKKDFFAKLSLTNPQELDAMRLAEEKSASAN